LQNQNFPDRALPQLESQFNLLDLSKTHAEELLASWQCCHSPSFTLVALACRRNDIAIILCAASDPRENEANRIGLQVHIFVRTRVSSENSFCLAFEPASAPIPLTFRIEHGGTVKKLGPLSRGRPSLQPTTDLPAPRDRTTACQPARRAARPGPIPRLTAHAYPRGETGRHPASQGAIYERSDYIVTGSCHGMVL
jgi:hypothetical protein